MNIKKFFSEKKEFFLTPDFFKDIFLFAYPDLPAKYDLGKIFFAECYEQEISYYPLVFMKLLPKDNNRKDYVCFIPKTAQTTFWHGKMSYRELGYRDVAHSIDLLVDNEVWKGKIAVADGKLGFRFRTT